MPSTNPAPWAATMRRIAMPNRSSPTLPISRVAMPSLCSTSPVFETAPPVESTAGPTSLSLPGVIRPASPPDRGRDLRDDVQAQVPGDDGVEDGGGWHVMNLSRLQYVV